MTEIQQRSYTNGVYYRPKPYVLERSDSHLLTVSIPWGPVESARRVGQIVTEQFELLDRDDMTTPFESIPSISSAANRLRMGALTANQSLFRQDNGKIWRSAVELCGIHFDRRVLSWVQVGCPHLLLLEKNMIHPLAYEPDWSQQSGNQGPLFSQALGLEGLVPLKAGSLRVSPGAQLLMIARSALPRTLFQFEKFELESLVQSLIDDDHEAPFWAGLIEL
jgi:hypothetical protein